MAKNQKIVNDEIIFVLSKVAKAEHTKRYVSISISEEWCKKNSSERFFYYICTKYINRYNNVFGK